MPKHIFSSQQTKILTFTQKCPKTETGESFRVAVRWLAVKKLSRASYRGCQEAVRLSGKSHHNFEAKIKFGRGCRYHRRAYPTPSVLTPAKFDLCFRLSRVFRYPVPSDIPEHALHQTLRIIISRTNLNEGLSFLFAFISIKQDFHIFSHCIQPCEHIPSHVTILVRSNAQFLQVVGCTHGHRCY